MIIKFLILILLIIPFSANATTYYVSSGTGGTTVCSNGNDSNNGTAITTPWLTIRHATTVINAGDTLNICGGTYTDIGGVSGNFVTFSHSGTFGNVITVQGYNNEVATLDAGFGSDGGSLAAPTGYFITDGVTYITINRVHIENCYRTCIEIGYNSDSQLITVTNSELYNLNCNDNCGFVMVQSASSATGNGFDFENNHCHHISTSTGSGTSGECIWGGLGSGNWTIKNNEMNDLIQGINIKYGAASGSGQIIQNNNFHDITTFGMTANNTGVTINNNIFNRNADIAIMVGNSGGTCSASNIIITNNTIIASNQSGGNPEEGTIRLAGPAGGCAGGAIGTLVRNNLFYQTTTSTIVDLAIWPYDNPATTDQTTGDYNLYYNSLDSTRIIDKSRVFESLASWKADATNNSTTMDQHSVQGAPTFVNYAGDNFTLAPSSLGYGTGYLGANIGACIGQVGVGNGGNSCAGGGGSARTPSSKTSVSSITTPRTTTTRTPFP